MSSTAILIADNHELFRRGVPSLPEFQPDCSVCDEAADGVEAVEKAKRLRPHVVFLDFSMQRMDGIEVNRIIRREVTDSQVVLAGQKDPATVSRQAAEAGADGCVDEARIAVDVVPTIKNIVGIVGISVP